MSWLLQLKYTTDYFNYFDQTKADILFLEIDLN